MTTFTIKGVEPKVLKILGGDPTLSYSIIAAEVGVTRERVRQIARQNGYPPRNGVLKPKVCPICGDKFYTRNLYCSSDCRYKAAKRKIVLNCHQCGKPIERTPGNMRSKSGRYFCSKECFKQRSGNKHNIVPKDRKQVVGNFVYEIAISYEPVQTL